MESYVVKDRASSQNWAISVSDDLAITITETEDGYSPEPIIADSLDEGVFYTVFVNDGNLGIETYVGVETNNIIELSNASAGRSFILVVRDGTLALVVGNVLTVSGTDLTTMTKVKSFLHVTDNEDDVTIQMILTAVSRYVAKYCDREFLLTDYTEYFNGHGNTQFVLSNYPVNSVTTVHDDTDRAYGSDTLISSADYVWWSDGRIELEDGDLFSSGKKNVKVVYNAGYTQANVPYDLQMVVWRIIQFIYKDSQTAIAGPEQLDIAGMIMKFRNSEVKEILDRYRKIATR